MAENTTGGRPINVSVPTIDFMRGMRGAKSQAALDANTNLMTSVDIPLFSGKDLPDDKRSQFSGKSRIDLNLGKLANVPAGILDTLGTEQKAPCDYTGNTPSETPVTIKTSRNLSEQNPKLRDTVKMTIDLQAVANANDIERDNGLRKKNLPTLMTGDPAKDKANPALRRVPVELSNVNSVNGVTGISAESVKCNLGEMAAEHYLLTASKSNPDASMVSKDAVSSLGDLYTKEFKAFATKYADKACTGIKSSEKQEDGTYKSSGKAIEGTAFKSLKEMGIKPVELDNGGMVLACIDGSDSASANRKGKDGLVAFNNAFNKHMSQVVNKTFDAKSTERNLGNNLEIQTYQTTAPGNDSVTMFQPSLVMTTKPYATYVTRAVECATHQNTKPYEDLYGKGVLENTRTIQSYFPDKPDSTEKDKVLQEVNDKLEKAGLKATKSYEAAQRGGNDGPTY